MVRYLAKANKVLYNRIHVVGRFGFLDDISCKGRGRKCSI